MGVLLAVSLASAAANPAGLMYQPFNYGFNGYSGLPYGLAGHNSRIPYTVPAIAAPTVTETGIDTIISDFPSEFPNIPGLDENQKELIHMVTSLKPEVTAQLARIAANVGPWAARHAIRPRRHEEADPGADRRHQQDCHPHAEEQPQAQGARQPVPGHPEGSARSGCRQDPRRPRDPGKRQGHRRRIDIYLWSA